MSYKTVNSILAAVEQDASFSEVWAAFLHRDKSLQLNGASLFGGVRMMLEENGFRAVDMASSVMCCIINQGTEYTQYRNDTVPQVMYSSMMSIARPGSMT